MDSLRTEKNINIKKITLISILVSLCVILSIFDKFISQLAFPFLPTAKIGLANIVIVYAIYEFNYKDTLSMVILKSILAGFIFGGLIQFLISFVASILSFIGMFISYKLLKNVASCISISVIGGFLHIVGQLMVVFLIYDIGDAIVYYGAVLIFVSLITSIIIGFIAIKLISFMKNIKTT